MNRICINALPFRSLSLVTGIFALTLAGCTTLTPEQQREADQQTCLSYGFKPKSEALANCLLQINLDRRADIRAWQNSQPQFSAPMIIYQPVLVRR